MYIEVLYVTVWACVGVVVLGGLLYIVLVGRKGINRTVASVDAPKIRRNPL